MTAHKKHGAISVVSAMLTSVRHNSFVLVPRPTEPDPNVTANMEQTTGMGQRKCSEKILHVCSLYTKSATWR